MSGDVAFLRVTVRRNGRNTRLTLTDFGVTPTADGGVLVGQIVYRDTRGRARQRPARIPLHQISARQLHMRPRGGVSVTLDDPRPPARRAEHTARIADRSPR